MGTPLVWSAHRISLRQHGGGSGIVSKVSQPPNPVSFAQVPVFWEARHNFEHSADHLAGKSNTAADTLSRNNLKSFRSLTSQAKAVPTVVPAQVLSLLMDPNLHWTVQKFFEQDLAAAISRTYASAKNRYLSFCQQANILPYSITQPTLCLFAAFLAQQGLAPQSVSCYLSAVRHLRCTRAPQLPLDLAGLTCITS